MCGSFATGGQIVLSPQRPNEPVKAQFRREIYTTFDGYLDCATNSCWVHLGMIFNHPIDDGEHEWEVGSTVTLARAIIDFDPTVAPAPRPTISILESGPHRAGDTVTVEVANPLPSWRGGVGWCRGSPLGCSYLFATEDPQTGIWSVEWTISDNADEC